VLSSRWCFDSAAATNRGPSIPTDTFPGANNKLRLIYTIAAFPSNYGSCTEYIHTYTVLSRHHPKVKSHRYYDDNPPDRRLTSNQRRGSPTSWDEDT
jgi:hypothetical protein